MKIQDFVVLDLETTGLSVKEDQILEIGAVKVQGGEVTASYETFVNGQKSAGADHGTHRNPG